MPTRYKVLPADRWMLNPNHWMFEDTIKYYEEIEPVFNRVGQYYDRETKTWWFESGGQAWTDPKGSRNKNAHQFLWELAAYNSTVLSNADKENLRRIISSTTSRKLRRQLKQMIYDSDNAELLHFGGTLKSRLDNFSCRSRIRKMTND